MLNELREAIEAVERARHESERVYMDEAARELTELVTALMAEPTNVQALALARLMRDRPNAQTLVNRNAFDLPDGYWEVVFRSAAEPFVCGIAPDGSVSS